MQKAHCHDFKNAVPRGSKLLNSKSLIIFAYLIDSIWV